MANTDSTGDGGIWTILQPFVESSPTTVGRREVVFIKEVLLNDCTCRANSHYIIVTAEHVCRKGSLIAGRLLDPPCFAVWASVNREAQRRPVQREAEAQ